MKKDFEKKLQKGGQLTWQGVDLTKDLGDFMADEVTTIYDSKDSLFAIGALAIGSQEVSKDKEMEGHAAFILHFKGDSLYVLGDQEDKQVIYDGK